MYSTVSVSCILLLLYLYETINVYNKEEEKQLEVGDIEFEPVDTSLIKVNENGHITPLKEEGTTELKIKDVTNGYYTIIKVIVNNKRIQDTDTVTYIYNIDDLVRFRDSVNAGNDYVGKTVYVMADIDMSPACSEESGVSWTPIGSTGTYFAGTFDGNYHKLDNIYINTTNSYQGLFAYNSGLLKICYGIFPIPYLLIFLLHNVHNLLLILYYNNYVFLQK